MKYILFYHHDSDNNDYYAQCIYKNEHIIDWMWGCKDTYHAKKTSLKTMRQLLYSSRKYLDELSEICIMNTNESKNLK